MYATVQQPRVTEIAIKLIYASLAIGIARNFFEFPQMMKNIPRGGENIAVITLIITFVVMLSIALLIDKGYNWARILFLVLFVLGTALSIQPLLATFATSTVLGIVAVLQSAMQLVALYLLFKKASSDWFHDMKAQR